MVKMVFRWLPEAKEAKKQSAVLGVGIKMGAAAGVLTKSLVSKCD